MLTKKPDRNLETLRIQNLEGTCKTGKAATRKAANISWNGSYSFVLAHRGPAVGADSRTRARVPRLARSRALGGPALLLPRGLCGPRQSSRGLAPACPPCFSHKWMYSDLCQTWRHSRASLTCWCIDRLRVGEVPRGENALAWDRSRVVYRRVFPGIRRKTLLCTRKSRFRFGDISLS